MRGRPPYAPGLADALRRILALDGQGRLLDVGCGPGIVTLPLAQLFTEVVGLDPDPGMLAEGARRAAEAGVENIVWVRARAEDLPAGLGRFRVATFAQSFHWMDRDRVAALVLEMLEPGGALVHISDCQGRRGTGSLRRRAPSSVAAISGDARADSTLSRPGAARRAGFPSLRQPGWRSNRPAQRRVPGPRARASTGWRRAGARRRRPRGLGLFPLGFGAAPLWRSSRASSSPICATCCTMSHRRVCSPNSLPTPRSSSGEGPSETWLDSDCARRKAPLPCAMGEGLG